MLPSKRLRKPRAALRALDLENLTLEFSEEKDIYHYRGKNGGTEIFGQFTIFTLRYGDEPFPFHPVYQTLWSGDVTTPFCRRS